MQNFKIFFKKIDYNLLQTRSETKKVLHIVITLETTGKVITINKR
jgi:hypothetical protein